MDVEEEEEKRWERGEGRERCAHGKMMIIIRRGPVQRLRDVSLVLWDSACETRLLFPLSTRSLPFVSFSFATYKAFAQNGENIFTWCSMAKIS